jgi:hypothetical protein
MDEQSVLELMKDWGYYLLAKPYPDSLGYGRLLVAIRKQPTGEHFDPQRIELHLRDEYGLAVRRILSWLSPLESIAHACPGLITLHDRSDKQVYFFSFGGTLEETPGVDEMVYELRSPAPVLRLTGLDDEAVQDQLASETEELLGEIEVKWGTDEGGFSRRLATVDPLWFYRAVLQSLLRRYERAQPLDRVYHDLHDALCREREWLAEKGQWSAQSSTLEDLLAPA